MIRSAFGIRRSLSPDLTGRLTGPPLAEQHPAPPDDTEPPAPTVADVLWEHLEPDTRWDGKWTVRPPSTLAAEITAIHDEHVAWVLATTGGHGVLGPEATVVREDTIAPYVTAEVAQ